MKQPIEKLMALSLAALLTGCGQQEPPATPPDAAPPAPSADTPPASTTATVQLTPTQGNTANGSLALTAEGESVRLTGTIQGLPPNGQFGFHIHEKGDCSAPDASSAGEHFNPANAQHGNPHGAAHHAGDMLNLTSDAQGVAQVDTGADGATLNRGLASDVQGRALVLHEKADDYATQPSGDSGARIACGVIGSS
jgi:Cu-Zn family superoxide dismutase